MIRLLTEREKNTSWVPREENFMTKDALDALFAKTKSADEEVSFMREELPTDYFDKKTQELPPVPDTITITEAVNDLSL